VTTLVFLHGWGASGRIWQRQLAALGEGQAALAPEVAAWETAWFRQYLSELRLPDCLLVGWSLGGMLLAETLAQFPGPPPAGLVLVGVSASFCRRPDFPEGQSAAGVRAMRRGLRTDPQKVLADFARSCLVPGEEAHLDGFMAACQSPPQPAHLALGLDYLLGQDLRRSLNRLPVPPVLVHGGEDGIVAASQAEFLHQRLPGSRLHLLPGAGHLPFWTRAPAFNEVLQAILREDKGSKQ
jgi:pimeloyl-ACP methyl ester carboxylesterase